MSKKTEIQKFTRWMREKTGRDLTAHELAEALAEQGWKLPEPKSAVDILAKEVADALREETRFDKFLKRDYRSNVCYKEQRGDKQLTFWGDIDQATRRIMTKNVSLRRDQMLGDALQLTIDAMHWNRINPNEHPVQPELDFTDDVQWALNAPRSKGKAA